MEFLQNLSDDDDFPVYPVIAAVVLAGGAIAYFTTITKRSNGETEK